MRKSILLAALLFGAAAANATPAVWESNYGTTFLSGDDNYTSTALGFAFPIFGGSFTSTEVSTNGFLSFGPGNATGCCAGNVGGLLAFSPRIAVEWLDLVTFVNINTAVAGRAVVTWTGSEYGYGGALTAQAQLFSDGRIILGFDGPLVPAHQALTGLSEGAGAADPGGSDLNSGDFNSGNTFYQLFGAGTFDLNQGNLFINPRAGGGFHISSVAPAVTGGVPEPASWAFLTVGFGLAGATLRRRRDRGVAA